MRERSKLLIVEDSTTDAELAIRELKRAAFPCETLRVDTEPEYSRAIREFRPDVILSDFSMPHFDGMEALRIAVESCPDVPFIFVSGTLGEDYAVRALKNGATDYVLKTNLIRLPAAVERALRDAKERRARSLLQQQVHDSEERFRQLAENVRDVFWVHEVTRDRNLYVNPAYRHVWGSASEPLKDAHEQWEESLHPDDRVFALEAWSELCSIGKPMDVEYRIVLRDGTERWIHDRGFPVRDSDEQVYRAVGIAEDITERKLGDRKLRESEAKYRQLIEQASDGIFVSDAEGNFILANSQGCHLLGYSESELVGMNGSETYLEHEKHLHVERMSRLKPGEVLLFERMVRRKNGGAFPAEISVKMLDNGSVQVIFRDITQRRTQEDKIARLSRIQAVLGGINSTIARIRDRQKLLDEACRIAVDHGGFRMAWIGLLDKEGQKINVASWAGFENGFFDICHRMSVVAGTFAGEGAPGRALRGRSVIVINDFASDPLIHYRHEHLTRGYRAGIVLPLVTGGEALGVLAMYVPEKNFFDEDEVKLLQDLAADVSFALEYIDKEEKLKYLAYYDALTGLPNSTLFHDRLTLVIGSARRGASSVAAILLNLDRFRQLNETMGRHAGDMALKLLAERIRQALPESCTVARTTADTFAIAMDGIKHADEVAGILQERILGPLGQPLVLNDQEIRISAKAGIALYPTDGADEEGLFRNAEAALKQAKATGSRYLFYAPEMNARVAEKLTLENKLRVALERNEFVLHYQPKVQLRTRGISGLEALIRWNDPESGLVPPARFIPLLEETGMILDVGAWAIGRALEDRLGWERKGLKAPPVAVNVSALQLLQNDFLDVLRQSLKGSDGSASGLDLEITESLIMENIEGNIQKFAAIRELGLGIAIDDFGTGYSSLSYLAKLPVNALKIDRSFVDSMTISRESATIVSMIISLAHSLNLKVIAEGVETQEQLDSLEQLGCDEIQGYLISRPIASDRLAEFLSR